MLTAHGVHHRCASATSECFAGPIGGDCKVATACPQPPDGYVGAIDEKEMGITLIAAASSAAPTRASSWVRTVEANRSDLASAWLNPTPVRCFPREHRP